MKNKKDNKTCYVFSQVTLEIALKEWFEIMVRKNPNKKESYQIAVVALPWLLNHLEQNSPIIMFTHDNLIKEMELWKSKQLSKYVNQDKRIKETCNLLMNFFDSNVVIEYKMIIQA